MKLHSLVSHALFGLGAVVLAGCPIYSGSSGYSEPIGGPGPSGQISRCFSPSDCPGNTTCGSDDLCHSSDCVVSGCPSGYQCKISDGEPECVSTTTGHSDAGPGNHDSGSVDSGVDSGPPFTGCQSDDECISPAGSRCLDGTCTAPSNQCSDGTQCTGGSQCVQGVCTPSCASGAACPTGYSCDTGKGVCTGNPTPCGTAPNATACAGGTVCAQDHCVTACGPGGTCTSGLVCIQGGCVPDQKPRFVCDVEGVQDACHDGSICLHHSCYIACSGDGGANTCKSADQFNTCKSVQTGTGTYAVCGSSSNLGTECDPTQSKGCASPSICIDGYCR